jgi:hypothetical protein
LESANRLAEQLPPEAQSRMRCSGCKRLHFVTVRCYFTGQITLSPGSRAVIPFVRWLLGAQLDEEYRSKKQKRRANSWHTVWDFNPMNHRSVAESET